MAFIILVSAAKSRTSCGLSALEAFIFSLLQFLVFLSLWKRNRFVSLKDERYKKICLVFLAGYNLSWFLIDIFEEYKPLFLPYWIAVLAITLTIDYRVHAVIYFLYVLIEQPILRHASHGTVQRGAFLWLILGFPLAASPFFRYLVLSGGITREIGSGVSIAFESIIGVLLVVFLVCQAIKGEERLSLLDAVILLVFASGAVALNLYRAILSINVPGSALPSVSYDQLLATGSILYAINVLLQSGCLWMLGHVIEAPPIFGSLDVFRGFPLLMTLYSMTWFGMDVYESWKSNPALQRPFELAILAFLVAFRIHCVTEWALKSRAFIRADDGNQYVRLVNQVPAQATAIIQANPVNP